MTSSPRSAKNHAWNPGLESTIPERLMPRATIFRPEYTTVDYTEASELSRFCGIKPNRLVAFRVERLIQHELLIRVTADLSVPDGPNYEELGINLRMMVAVLYEQHVLPEIDAISSEFEEVRRDAQKILRSELSKTIFKPPQTAISEKPATGWRKWFGRGKSDSPTPSADHEPVHLIALESWKRQARHESDDLHRSCLESLQRIVGSITGFRGRLVTDLELTIRLACNDVMNRFGSMWVHNRISNLFDAGVAQNSYRYLPHQEKPVIMNVKGSSAAGKSTIRPQQRELANKLGIPWEDFALISPDYWRKYLLEYESLDEDFRYGAMLTGQELEMIDRKLDDYMAHKASVDEIPHLLIDRFRFDSFTLEQDRGADSRLLTRFGDRIFLFFVVTPPAETVTRAWERGLKTGRYKAVDDLLYHNIEAYTGMPELFFAWAASSGKTVHLEFLDNDVPLGKLPLTIAYGWNGSLTILDVKRMVDIERFRKVNVEAKKAAETLKAGEMAAEDNLRFVLRCIRELDEVIFADQKSGKSYAHVIKGKLVWLDEEYIKKVRTKETQVLFEKLGPCDNEHARPVVSIKKEKQFTFGRWN